MKTITEYLISKQSKSKNYKSLEEFSKELIKQYPDLFQDWTEGYARIANDKHYDDLHEFPVIWLEPDSKSSVYNEDTILYFPNERKGNVGDIYFETGKYNQDIIKCDCDSSGHIIFNDNLLQKIIDKFKNYNY